MKLTCQKAFTLIEIIVVLIILGILAAISVPSFFNNINKSRSTEALISFSAYKSGIEGCIQGHQHTESLCHPTFVSTLNFSYSFGKAPGDDDPDYTLIATGQNLLTSTDTMMLTRTGGTAEASYSCQGTGDFIGYC